MKKQVILFIILLLASMQPCGNAYAVSVKLDFPIEVSGKILDRDGNPFTDDIEIKLCVSTDYLDFSKSGSQMQSTEDNIYKIDAKGGIFSWKGQGSGIRIEAIKEGYHSTVVYVYDTVRDNDAFIKAAQENDMVALVQAESIKTDDILIYLIPKGTSSILQYTERAYIPLTNEKQSSGKQCGWSFAKRWYFPVDEDIPVDIVLGTNDSNKRTYTMKEPGGFVYCSGFPRRKSTPNELYNDFNLMPKAPEEGYVQTVCPSDNFEKEQRGIYYYFRTPDGKYGKICFKSDFSYYINPDSSRDLEAGEVVRKGPRNPIEAEWLDIELGEDN